MKKYLFIFILASLLCGAKNAQAAIAFVEGNSEALLSFTADVSTTAFTATAGNTIYVSIRYFSSANITSITDTAGNTYTKIDENRSIGNITNQESWYATNITGNASNVITFHFSDASSQFVWGGHLQFSGMAASSFDTSAKASNASASSITTNSFTTAQADEVLVFAGTVGATNDSFTATGYTQGAQDANKVITFYYKIVSSVQTGATATWQDNTTARSISMILGAFKASGGTPPVVTENIVYKSNGTVYVNGVVYIQN